MTSEPRPTVFVTGATGVVGAAVVRHLVRRADVRALVRSRVTALPTRVTPIHGDLEDEAALQRGAEGADAVIHLAAKLHVNSPAAELDSLYRRVNTESTTRLVDLARSLGVTRFAYASTINVYGPSAGREPWTEVDRPAPQTYYAQTKLDAEAAVRSLPEGIVLRLSAVYGPGMKGNYPPLARLLRRGVRVLPGTGRNRRTLVHVYDAARAFVLAAMGEIPSGTYNVTDGSTHTFDEIVRSLQDAVGRQPGVYYVPGRPVRVAGDAISVVASLVGVRLSLASLVDKLMEDVAVSGDALQEVSPYRPAVRTLAEGWSGSVAPL